jgi:RNA polymerase sigma-70 factor (ECF subfamily)
MPQGVTNTASGRNAREPALERLSDEQIMLEVQQGSGDAFAVLFDRYHRLVLVTALKIVRDVGEAQEVTQNVFLEIYRAARRFDPARGTLKVWLLQYAYHRSINRRNYLLLRHFYNRQDLDEAATWEASARTVPQAPVQEVKHLLKEALGTLNEAQRRTIEKVFFGGLTLSEVAEQTHESLSNARNHYYRGLDRLRVCLAPKSIVADDGNTPPLGEASREKA